MDLKESLILSSGKQSILMVIMEKLSERRIFQQILLRCAKRRKWTFSLALQSAEMRKWKNIILMRISRVKVRLCSFDQYWWRKIFIWA